MRRVASLLGRLLVGLAATAFLLGAILFLLGLHLSMLPLRARAHVRLQLAFEIAERAAAIALLSRSDGTATPSALRARPRRGAPTNPESAAASGHASPEAD